MRVPLLIAASAFVLGACESTVVGPSGADISAPEAVSFAADVQPLFAARCGTCHTAESQAGVNVATHAATLASVGTQYDEAIVRPGDADGSPLVDKLEAAPRLGARMPIGGAPLSADEVALVRAWIDAGALDN